MITGSIDYSKYMCSGIISNYCFTGFIQNREKPLFYNPGKKNKETDVTKHHHPFTKIFI